MTLKISYILQRKTFSHAQSKLQFGLAYFYFSIYVQELYLVPWKKFHPVEHLSFRVYCDHNISLSLVLDPDFDSSMFC